MGEFFSWSDICRLWRLSSLWIKCCVLTPEIQTLSDLKDLEAVSSDIDEDDEKKKFPSVTECIQALKTVTALLRNSEDQEKKLQKILFVENAICDVDAKSRTQSKIIDFFKT